MRPDVAAADQRQSLMDTPPLSFESIQRVRLLFPSDEQELVRSLLVAECGNNLPGLEDADSVAMDGFRFAVLKLSNDLAHSDI